MAKKKPASRAKPRKAYDKFYPILSAIKRCFSRSPIRREALNKAKHPTEKGPKGGVRYTCKECGVNFSQQASQVDHIEPIVPVDMSARDMSWDEIVDRIYCDPENFQVLCRACHTVKSKAENKQRRKNKNDTT